MTKREETERRMLLDHRKNVGFDDPAERHHVAVRIKELNAKIAAAKKKK